jgi:uncharacterized circularly permuted ATP-grasp superfamily protein
MFKGYAADKFYDEMFSPDGKVRPHCEPLHEKFQQIENDDFLSRKATSELYFMRQGITFNVYHDNQGSERIFPFDPVPRVIPADEWELIEAGLTQRITALNLFLNDIYHDQEILKDGVIPRFYIEDAKSFRKEFRGVDVPKDIYIQICGSDLIRGGDGTYYVLEDNARCPSGASYLLENRNALKRAFPALFDSLGVRPVDSYPRDLVNMLNYISPRREGESVCVLLTPGCFNSAYFEHCYLARQMGIEIVEGRDLIVENERVYMHTTRGLVQVDVIYRRIDDDFLDPRFFRRDSTLGVPDLVKAYRAGNVTLVNAIGTGVADDKATYAYVPDMIRFYLSEEPILPNIETFLGSRPDELTYMIENMANLVVKAVDEAGGYGMLIGPAATSEEVADFREKVKANPRGYIAQPVISLSRHPTFCDGDLEGRHIDLRPFVLTGEDTVVVPGGLTRVALRKGSLVVNSSQGGGSKDTWVLRETAAPTEA